MTFRLFPVNSPLPSPATPPQGWVFYDGLCPLCLATVARWGPRFRRRGFDFAPLQSDWVLRILGLRPGELPGEIKLLRPDGRLLGGVDALRVMARTVWWLRPFAALAGWPGLEAVAWASYRWVAARRHCLGDVCGVPRQSHARHAATTFLELP